MNRTRVARRLVAAIVAVAISFAAAAIAKPASADSLDGTWQVNEFAIWEHSGFSGAIFDTTSDRQSNYTRAPIYFLNSMTLRNDNASSSANGFYGWRICAHEHKSGGGPEIIHLANGQQVGGVSYIYSSLGWANDKYSSHYDC